MDRRALQLRSFEPTDGPVVLELHRSGLRQMHAHGMIVVDHRLLLERHDG